MNILENEELSKHTTFKIGGPADFFVSVENDKELIEAFFYAKEKKIKSIVIGGGSNLIFDDAGFDGLVIKNNIKGIRVEKEDIKEVLLYVGGGVLWDDLVSFSVSSGFFGLENLPYIPGLVGASAVQNIGAYGVEVKDFIFKVRVFDTEDECEKLLTKEECQFDYRTSLFKNLLRDDGEKRYIILGIYFMLSKIFKPNISYKDLKTYFEGKNPSPSELRNAVIEIRKNKFPDLALFGTAGSYFKNPIVSVSVSDNLLKQFPELPVYDFNNQKKISAAWILDQVLHLKGFEEEGVSLFLKQPLVLAVKGDLSSEKVLKFAKKIKKLFFEKTGILLEEEVEYVKK